MTTSSQDTEIVWQPIKSAPRDCAVFVRNSVLEAKGREILATRGYGGDDSFNNGSRLFTALDGSLVYATEWRAAR